MFVIKNCVRRKGLFKLLHVYPVSGKNSSNFYFRKVIFRFFLIAEKRVRKKFTKLRNKGKNYDFVQILCGFFVVIL